jgi:hypothetical protein
MIPQRYDYLVTLAVLVLFMVAAYSREICRASGTREFWSGGLTFVLLCGALEVIGLSMRWWAFDMTKTCGLRLHGIPVEEFILFSLIYVLAISGWEHTDS